MSERDRVDDRLDSTNQVIKYSLFDGGGDGSNNRSIQPIFLSSFRKFKSIVSRKSGGFVRPRYQFSIQRLSFTIKSVNNAIECVAAIGLVFRKFVPSNIAILKYIGMGKSSNVETQWH